MKLIIAGSRSFTAINRHLITDYMAKVLKVHSPEDLEIVSGNAVGADWWGEQWAVANKVDMVRFSPNWNRYGSRAGPMRNARMAEYADAAVVFWDGVSPGSSDMIEQMRKRGKFCKVIKFIPEANPVRSPRGSDSSASRAKKLRVKGR